MAEATAWTRTLDRWRSSKGLYHHARSLSRGVRHGWFGFFRAAGGSVRLGGPRGFYEGLELLRGGQREGKVLTDGQRLPPLPEGSLIECSGMMQNARQPWPVFWETIPEARLVGASLAPMTEDKLLMIEAVYGEEFSRSDPSWNYAFLPKELHLKGSWTSLISRWSEGFYHWFTDALPRLGPLADFPEGTGILIPPIRRNYQKESLAMLGLIDRLRETPERHLVLGEYHFSSPVGMTGCTNPRSVEWLRGRFLPHAAGIDTPKRIVLRRRGKTRGILNESEFYGVAEESDWVVIDPEEMPLAEQIAWFRNAKEVVAEHGAGLTNLLWSSPGCRVTELCAENFLNGCYQAIALCNHLDHRHRVFAADAGNRFVVPTSFIEELFRPSKNH